jgi:hypothetical protein
MLPQIIVNIVNARTFSYNSFMNCPKCSKPMRKVRWEITNNFKSGKEFKEYDKYTYECKDDDIWVTIETPIAEKPTNKSLK